MRGHRATKWGVFGPLQSINFFEIKVRTVVRTDLRSLLQRNRRLTPLWTYVLFTRTFNLACFPLHLTVSVPDVRLWRASLALLPASQPLQWLGVVHVQKDALNKGSLERVVRHSFK
jgi:hypothetical protein